MNDIDKYGQYTETNWFSTNENEDPTRELTIMSLGLAGETGEVVEHVKKLIRDGSLDLPALKLELGDVVFYWARLCNHFGLKPSEVIAANIAKLDSRRARGTQRGSGDYR